MEYGLSIINPITLFAVLILGTITSYTDIKYGKIKNRTTGLFFFFGLAYSVYSLSQNYSNDKLLFIAVNASISIIIGFVLWKLNFWSAGDGKLYTAYSILLPNIEKCQWGFQYFSSIYFFINTFLIVFIFLLAQMFTKNKPDEIFRNIKKNFSIKSIITIALFIFSVQYLIQIISDQNIGINPLIITYLFIMPLMMIKNKLIKYSIYGFSAIIAVFRAIFDPTIKQLNWWIIFLISVFVFYIIRLVLLSNPSYSTKVKASKLKAGDHIIVNKKTKLLTDKDIQLLKKQEQKEVEITQTMPFAVFLFAGALLSLFSGGNFIVLLLFLLSNY